MQHGTCTWPWVMPRARISRDSCPVPGWYCAPRIVYAYAPPPTMTGVPCVRKWWRRSRPRLSRSAAVATCSCWHSTPRRWLGGAGGQHLSHGHVVQQHMFCIMGHFWTITCPFHQKKKSIKEKAKKTAKNEKLSKNANSRFEIHLIDILINFGTFRF